LQIFIAELFGLLLLTGSGVGTFHREDKLSHTVIRYLASRADCQEFHALFGFLRRGRATYRCRLDRFRPFARQLLFDDATEVANGHVQNTLGLLAGRVAALEARAERVG